MKQALKQQGFVGVGKKQTEWAAWMEREKEALTEIAQRHDFEIISLGTNRPHMDLPQFREAAARLEVVQQQTAAAEQEIVELERQRDALKGTVRLLKEADKCKCISVRHTARKNAHRGCKGRDGGSGRAAKEDGSAQRDGSA